MASPQVSIGLRCIGAASSNNQAGLSRFEDFPWFWCWRSEPPRKLETDLGPFEFLWLNGESGFLRERVRFRLSPVIKPISLQMGQDFAGGERAPPGTPLGFKKSGTNWDPRISGKYR